MKRNIDQIQKKVNKIEKDKKLKQSKSVYKLRSKEVIFLLSCTLLIMLWKTIPKF